jgi:hypothetical protein
MSSALAACTPVLASRRGELECQFDDSYARYWIVTPPKHATDLSDLQAAAKLRFETLFSSPVDEWRIEAEWQNGRDFLACALPQRVLAVINQSLSTALVKVRLTRCIPYFLGCWNRAALNKQLRPACFAVTADSTTTISLLDETGQCIRAVFSLPLAVDSDAHIEEVENRICAYCIQRDLPPPENILLTGQIAAQLATVRGRKLQWVVRHESV